MKLRGRVKLLTSPEERKCRDPHGCGSDLQYQTRVRTTKVVGEKQRARRARDYELETVVFTASPLRVDLCALVARDGRTSHKGC